MQSSVQVGGQGDECPGMMNNRLHRVNGFGYVIITIPDSMSICIHLPFSELQYLRSLDVVESPWPTMLLLANTLIRRACTANVPWKPLAIGGFA